MLGTERTTEQFANRLVMSVLGRSSMHGSSSYPPVVGSPTPSSVRETGNVQLAVRNDVPRATASDWSRTARCRAARKRLGPRVDHELPDSFDSRPSRTFRSTSPSDQEKRPSPHEGMTRRARLETRATRERRIVKRPERESREPRSRYQATPPDPCSAGRRALAAPIARRDR